MHTIRAVFSTLPLSLFLSCGGLNEEFVIVNTQFNFINDTQFEIRIVDSGCGFEEIPVFGSVNISSLDTLVVTQKNRLYMIPPQPKVENFELFIGDCFAIYGDSIKCEFGAFTGIRNVENYEKKEEVSENNFEFTYRFTEQTMNEARDCP